MIALTLKILRTDRRTRTSALLTAVGVAVATALVLLLIGIQFATQARADRAGWQEPGVSATTNVNALQYSGKDYSHNDLITRVDVAPTGDPAKVSLPQGMPTLPAPGQALLSPALAKRANELAPQALADRFGEVVGILGDGALVYPGQLVAVVGHTQEEMPAYSTPITGLRENPAVPDPLLQPIAGIGLVVLLVPSLALAASAARLTARRRERRLAAFMLAGATPRQVVKMVGLESGVAAAVGALVGVGLSFPLAVLCRQVPWGGGVWFPDDLLVPIWAGALIALAVPALVVASVVITTREVVRSPLSVAGSHGKKAPHALRLLMIPVAALAFVAVAKEDAAAGQLMVLGALGLVLVTASVVGPFVTSRVGKVFVRGWRRAPGLMAGRRLVDDPRGAYRACSGVVLAVFIGCMALTLFSSLDARPESGQRSFQASVLYVKATPAQAAQISAETDAALRRYGIDARATTIGSTYVTTDTASHSPALVLSCVDAERLTRFDFAGTCDGKPGIWSKNPTSTVSLTDSRAPLNGPIHQVGGDPDLDGSLVIDPTLVRLNEESAATVAVPTTDTNREAFRTALGAAAKGKPVESSTRLRDDNAQIVADLRRVTIIGLLIATVLAGVSAAVTSAGSVMDRRRTFGSLIAAGTPTRVLTRALRTEAALPALIATVGAGIGGTFTAMGLLATGGEIGVMTPWVAAPVALGVLVAVVAASASGPTLKRIAGEPLGEE